MLWHSSTFTLLYNYHKKRHISIILYSRFFQVQKYYAKSRIKSLLISWRKSISYLVSKFTKKYLETRPLKRQIVILLVKTYRHQVLSSKTHK